SLSALIQLFARSKSMSNECFSSLPDMAASMPVRASSGAFHSAFWRFVSGSY
ncbi:unnamed protein product, partial [Ceratitis capitata]